MTEDESVGEDADAVTWNRIGERRGGGERELVFRIIQVYLSKLLCCSLEVWSFGQNIDQAVKVYKKHWGEFLGLKNVQTGSIYGLF